VRVPWRPGAYGSGGILAARLVKLVQNYLNALEGAGALEALRARWFEDASWLDQLP
jgi:hypothetical protein